MKLNDSDSRTIAALHESGHAATHHLFRHRINEVVVGDGSGHCRLAGPQEFNALEYIIAMCAGKAAMDKHFGWRVESAKDQNWHESDDHKDALTAALKVSDGNPEAAEILVQWGEAMADSLVEREWPRITKLAGAVIKLGKLSGEQVTVILNGSNGA